MDRKTQHGQDESFPYSTYRFNATPFKILACYFVNIDKLIVTFIWKGKTQNRPHYEKKNKGGTVIQYNFRTNYKATIMKKMWYC